MNPWTSKKLRILFFQKPSKIFRLPHLTVNNHKTKQVKSIKFLEILLDENLTWKEHLKYTENRFTKNIGLLYKTKTCLHAY